MASLRVTGARKPPLHEKGAVLKQGIISQVEVRNSVGDAVLDEYCSLQPAFSPVQSRRHVRKR
jgi:hypothetical protein